MTLCCWGLVRFGHLSFCPSCCLLPALSAYYIVCILFLVLIVDQRADLKNTTFDQDLALDHVNIKYTSGTDARRRDWGML